MVAALLAVRSIHSQIQSHGGIGICAEISTGKDHFVRVMPRHLRVEVDEMMRCAAGRHDCLRAVMACTCPIRRQNDAEDHKNAGYRLHETTPEMASRIDISGIEMPCSFSPLGVASIYS